MKIVLCFPNQDYQSFIPMMRKHRFTNIKPRPNPMISLGMLYLVNAIKDICDVEYIDNNIHKLSTKSLTDYIKSRKPNIVGFGGTLTEWTQAKDVAAVLHKDEIITIYGGPNATANPKKHVKYFDYVFRGWAENTLRQFIKGLSNIPGLCWEDHIVSAALDINLNLLKYPARDVVDLNNYRREIQGLRAPVDIIVASRGCPFSCKFCSSKSIWNRVYKMRDVEDIIWEIKYMQEVFGTKTIHFREDNLIVNKNWLEKLCGELRKLKIDWLCQSRVNVLDEETVKMMKASGCKVICCGFESANDSSLQYIDKGFHFEDVINTINIFEKVGMAYSGGFMAGLLNEGEDEIKNTLEFTRKISQYPNSRIPRGAGRFVGWPMSETYQEIVDNDLIEFNWEDGEQLIPNTYKLSARQVEECIARNW